MTDKTGPGEGLPLHQDRRPKGRRETRGRPRGQAREPGPDGHHVLPISAFALRPRRVTRRS